MTTTNEAQPGVLTGSSVEQLSTCFARIAERDCEVRAWAHLNPELAMSYAVTADAEAPRSALHGVSVGLKDIIETGDQPTAYGSPIWTGHQPAQDAESVRRLREAGAVIMGKTTTTEFATYNPTLTMNPHNPGHTPGGSSSGSAAAVADGQVRIALGTQTAGSVNRPGSFCGVFTFKPTFDRWPFTGVLPVALTFDTLGGFARDPRDLVALDDVLANPRPEGGRARHRELPEVGTLRIGVLRGPWWDRAEPAAAAALDEMAQRLSSVVASVRDVADSELLEHLQTSHAQMQNHEAHFFLRDMIAPEPQNISEALRRNLDDAAAMTADQVQFARAALRDARTFAAQALAEFDLLITLAAPGEAPQSLESTGDPAFNRLASTAGLPSAGIPIGKGPQGLPLGLQIIAPQDADQALMAFVVHLTHDLGVFSVPELPGT